MLQPSCDNVFCSITTIVKELNLTVNLYKGRIVALERVYRGSVKVFVVLVLKIAP